MKVVTFPNLHTLSEKDTGKVSILRVQSLSGNVVSVTKSPKCQLSSQPTKLPAKFGHLSQYFADFAKS